MDWDPTGIAPALVEVLLDKGRHELMNVIKCQDKCEALDKCLKTVLRPMLSKLADSLPIDGSITAIGTSATEGDEEHPLDNIETTAQRRELPVGGTGDLSNCPCNCLPCLPAWWHSCCDHDASGPQLPETEVDDIRASLLGSTPYETETPEITAKGKIPSEGSTGLGAVKMWSENLERALQKAEKVVSDGNEVASLTLGIQKIWKLKKLNKRISKSVKEIDNVLGNQAALAAMHLNIETMNLNSRIDQKLDETMSLNLRMDQKLDERFDKLTNEIHSGGIFSQASNIDNLRQLPNNIFGHRQPLERLRNLLLSNEIENKWVGVCGRGGMGKTLLAEQTFNTKEVRDHFPHIFWLTVGNKPDVEKLLLDLAYQVDSQMDVKTEKRGDVQTGLFNALHAKKVLLLLDDVWDDDGSHVLDRLDVTSSTGSKILVTTRHIRVLTEKHALDDSIVRLDLLNDEESWELFCGHAFNGVDKIPGALDQGVVKEVVNRCKGLPLALKVTARALAHQRSSDLWKRSLNKLKEAHYLDPGHEVDLYGTLQLSYDALQNVNPRLQKCFVYFAAFPEDYVVDSEKLTNLWAGEQLVQARDEDDDDFDPSVECFYLLHELIDRSLIDSLQLPLSEKVHRRHLHCRVHDVLRDFARYLINENKAPMGCLFRPGTEWKEFPKTWLRGPNSDVTHVSLYNNKLKVIPNNFQAPRLEVLVLSRDHAARTETPLVISPELLEGFPNLKVLDLEYTHIVSLAESLGNLKSLIYLELSFTKLHQLPKRLQELTNLEYLSLRGLTEVEPWPFDISRLKNLSTLNTKGCENIWKPGLKFAGRNSLECLSSLTKLCKLSIRSSYHKYLPPQMSALVKLQHLGICFPSLCELPLGWVESLSHLTKLSFPGCSKLTSLPNISKLQKLWKLDLSGCQSLHQLPAGFARNGAFPNLTELDISNCKALHEFPQIEEGAFPKLVKLDISGCASLQQLPPGFTRNGAFPALKRLYIKHCEGLHEFPPLEEGAFPQLLKLIILACTSLQELPLGFARRGAFPSLKKLDIKDCEGLHEFPQIEETAFPQLIELLISGCTSLQELPLGFSRRGAFPSLKKLYIENCKGLHEFPPIEEEAFPQLAEFRICGCTSLQQLPLGFARSGAFPNLKRLYIKDCEGLHKFPRIDEGAFPQLVDLLVCRCTSLEQFPLGYAERGALPALKKLFIESCKGLHDFPPIEEGAFLQLLELRILGCTSLQQLPPGFGTMGTFPILKKLYIENCQGLHDFPPIENGAFSEVLELVISGCTSLQQLPLGFSRRGAFPALQKLIIKDCEGLHEFPPIEEEAFPQLVELSISGCTSLQHLHVGFSQQRAFPALKKLYVENCKGLHEFPPIEEGAFSQLIELRIWGCTSLQQLPRGFTRSGAFPTLEKLNIKNCEGLHEFPQIEEGAFPRLAELFIFGCTGLQKLPIRFTQKQAFLTLKKLYIENCIGLHEFPPIEEGAFPQLVELRISDCSSLQQLPFGFARSGAFSTLKDLTITHCNGLHEFPLVEEGAFPQLVTLRISHCASLQQLSRGFARRGTFPSLKKLYIKDCEGLCEFPPIEEGALPQLVSCHVPGFTRPQDLPRFARRGALPILEEINVPEPLPGVGEVRQDSLSLWQHLVQLGRPAIQKRESSEI